jgi:hypothetical protein
VTANNDQPALAQKLAEFLLTPQAQSAALEFGNQIPSNRRPRVQSSNIRCSAMRTPLALDHQHVCPSSPPDHALASSRRASIGDSCRSGAESLFVVPLQE